MRLRADFKVEILNTDELIGFTIIITGSFPTYFKKSLKF